ncbi:endonuclease/exonuclease/phosphatase family protein [Ornithinimicrobium flavum]|uniref:endonuclease/exonuclease/phosphatase family protein n=1 Tax=Ornithinimicrobium flavum TaxID=1288636 RepID=UPI001070055F|nr:endonuclease/exonuclease/phosphatase family protein [Ornithinimicrobium flavum]
MPDPFAPLRIASYNLRGLKDDASLAARVVRRITPDVLLVQEAPRHPLSSYAMTRFARESGMLWSGRTRVLSGTTLLTSLAVTASDAQDRRLRTGLRENPRSYTVATVRRTGGPALAVASVHLSLDARQRVEHVRAVLAEIEADTPSLPLVVGGDLNEGSDGTAWGALAGHLTEVSDDRPTFPAAHPRSRIDALFGRGHAGVTPGDPALLEGMGLSRASDHLPVWVDLQL